MPSSPLSHPCALSPLYSESRLSPVPSSVSVCVAGNVGPAPPAPPAPPWGSSRVLGAVGVLGER